MGFDAWIAIMLAGITILVTLLGVVLAALAIGIGLAAIWGYGGMVEAAKKAGTEAGREASLDEVSARAVEVARTTAEQIIRENKDKWLKEMALGLELSVAQSEPAKAASNTEQSVSRLYPGEEDQNASSDDNSGGDNPPTPEDSSH